MANNFNFDDHTRKGLADLLGNGAGEVERLIKEVRERERAKPADTPDLSSLGTLPPMTVKSQPEPGQQQQVTPNSNSR